MIVLRKYWEHLSSIGLHEYKKCEALELFREVLLINQLVIFILAIMAIYIPIEIFQNGFSLVPEILIAIGFLSLTLFFNHKKWFSFSKIYFFLASIISILPMMYLVPSGAGNEFLLLPIALIPAILFHNRLLGFLMFVFVVIIFFIVINTREWIHPIIEVTPEQIAFFRNIYLAMAFFLVFIIVFYFRTNVNNFEEINLEKNELLKLSNQEITAKKIEIEIQHNEIKDSIRYAKRIQSAILPPLKTVKNYFPNSFILYKPKSIVAGDFYWIEAVNTEKENKNKKTLFAAADCTGHGVPGAMVSVICNNALNRSVREYGLTDPGKILDKTREIVIQEFEKSDEDVKDGMDIALCSLEGNTLKYAGAHNPLWIIRNEEVIETKADKQPIGQFHQLTPFTTHTIELIKGDSIYIFSDGYVDQFGGEKGKKFKSKAFRQLLLSIQEHSMDEQKVILDSDFENWKGHLEQIDDVCVIGLRV